MSLSSAWFPDSAMSTRDALAEVRSLGFESIEWGISDLRLSEDEVARAVEAGEIAVSSIHALAGFAGGEIDPRGSHLGSSDRARRRASVDALCRTVRLGRRLKAGAIVTHAGMVGEGMLRMRADALVRLYQAHGDSPDFRREVDDLRRSRDREAPDYVERTVESLAEVVRREGEFPIAVECHYYYSDLPLPDELETMFAALGGNSFGYWHDCGHARMIQIFCGTAEMSWLDRFAGRLLGIHIHDMVGTRDHLPPGTGDLDLRGLATRLAGRRCARVVELGSRWSVEDVVACREYLESIGLG